MKPEIKLECDPTLPVGEMLCFDANGVLLSRQPTEQHPAKDTVRVVMSSEDFGKMLSQLGLI